MAFDYAQEKFSNAVRMLAVGRGSLKERLYDACCEISLIQCARDLPENALKLEVDNFPQRITCVSGGEAGAIQSTLNALSLDEAVEVAELIVALDYQLRSATA